MLLPLLVLWFAAGATIGLMFSKLINLRGDEPLLGIGVAGLGAMIAGLFRNLHGGQGFTGWNVWSLAFAAGGGLIAAILWHAIRSRFVSHERGTVRRSY